MYKVGVIGCGGIASLYNELTNNKNVLTHMSAYQNNNLTKIEAICDIDKDRLVGCGEYRNINNCYTDYKKMLVENDFDIVSICTPSNIRYELIKGCIDRDVKVILVEKPLTLSLEETNKIIELERISSSFIYINYSRRHINSILEIKNKISSFELGGIQSITINYNKGTFNNGSHFIDLCDFLFDSKAFEALTIRENKQDSYLDDKTYDFCLFYKFNNKIFPAYFISSNHKKYSNNRITLYADLGNIIVNESDDKVVFYNVKDDDKYQGYKTLRKYKTKKYQSELALTNIINDVCQSIKNNSYKNNLAQVNDALVIQQTIGAIRKSFLNNLRVRI